MNDREEQGSYGQFCPVAMASEILCSRWTILVLRELLMGSSRFSDLRRGVPRMSPTLLSKRLKELTAAGIIAADPGDKGGAEYSLTEAGEELREVVMSMGLWGKRWIESSLSLKNLDPLLLMWDMRRSLITEDFPSDQCAVKFTYPEVKGARKSWWLLVERGSVDLCAFDRGHDIDLYVTCPLRNMTSVWMGHSTLDDEVKAGNIVLSGDDAIARSMNRWLGLSKFAREKSRVAGRAPRA